jgi:hypothetical protein
MEDSVSSPSFETSGHGVSMSSIGLKQHERAPNDESWSCKWNTKWSFLRSHSLLYAIQMTFWVSGRNACGDFGTCAVDCWLNRGSRRNVVGWSILSNRVSLLRGCEFGHWNDFLEQQRLFNKQEWRHLFKIAGNLVRLQIWQSTGSVLKAPYLGSTWIRTRQSTWSFLSVFLGFLDWLGFSLISETRRCRFRVL